MLTIASVICSEQENENENKMISGFGCVDSCQQIEGKEIWLVGLLVLNQIK